MPRVFLVDTDTASDDAVALLMAMRWPDVEVAAIATVAGNVGVEQATRNAHTMFSVWYYTCTRSSQPAKNSRVLHLFGAGNLPAGARRNALGAMKSNEFGCRYAALRGRQSHARSRLP